MELTINETKSTGKETLRYAWLLDKLKAERERGVSIDSKSRLLETKSYNVVLLDTPGHRDFVHNTITAVSQADVVLLVVSAVKSEFEGTIEKKGQTREFLNIAYSMGVKKLIVAVNKMDVTSPPYSEREFIMCQKSVKLLAQKAGFKTNHVIFIPISAFDGDNLITSSPTMSWYEKWEVVFGHNNHVTGTTLLDALEKTRKPTRMNSKPLRVPVHSVYKLGSIGIVATGRVHGGSLRPKMEVAFAPTELKRQVRAVQIFGEVTDEGRAGDNVGMQLEHLHLKDVRRGMVCGDVYDDPPREVRQITAQTYKMPKKQAQRQILKYEHQRIVQAVETVKNGSMSVRVDAKTFWVPKSTIGDKVSGRNDLDTNIGRKPALPEEIENKIVGNVLEASKRGMGISRRQLFARTGILCKRMLVTPFKNGLPGRGWWNGLKKRHPELTIRKPEKLGNSRARMLNATVVSRYMTDLGNIITELNLHDKPHLIWNCDETGKQFQHTPIKVISQKGARNVVSRVSENRTNITIMACVNGAGAKMVPMVIVKGKTSAALHGLNVSEAPTGTVFAYQENGWMNEELGEKWFSDVFLKYCGPQRPQLLLLDGHSSHETLGLLELAVKEGIQILCLPPHTTHMLQPLDRSVFGPFNAAYNAACSEFVSESPYHTVNKYSFPNLFKKAWETAMTRENIVNGFRACGIVPFNPQAISTYAYNPAAATDKPEPSDITGFVPQLESATKLDVQVDATRLVSQTESSEHVAQAEPTRLVTQANHTVPGAQSESAAVYTLTDASECFDALDASETFQPVDASGLVALANAAELVTPDEVGHCPTLDDCAVCPSTAFNQIRKENYTIDDPEILLSLITSGQIEVISADSTCNDVDKFPSQAAALDQVSTSTCREDSVWNNAVESIFLPPNTPKENKPPKKSKAKTTHRLLTVENVIAEKKELLKKKELKKVKTQKRQKRRNAKLIVNI